MEALAHASSQLHFPMRDALLVSDTFFPCAARIFNRENTPNPTAKAYLTKRLKVTPITSERISQEPGERIRRPRQSPRISGVHEKKGEANSWKLKVDAINC